MIRLECIPSGDDPLLVWVAQGMRTGARAWTSGDAAAVACRDVSRRDRLALRGSVADVTELLGRIRPEVEGFFPIGDEPLIAALPGVEVVVHLGWMHTGTSSGTPPATSAHWLAESELSEVTALLETHHPHSFARPGDSGVTRWAGIRDEDSALLAVAADAWSAPEIGFVAGVATRTDARGRGLAAQLCAFVTDELLAGHGRVALLVEHENVAAVRTYERLGYGMRRLAAARFT
jgi:GNAT superfamily N-acetyltransferase